jgi:hypothetical protein
VIQDGDSFLVDGVGFEFDTGTVINVTAQNGGQLTDGTVITITDNQTTPNTETFEFDSNGTTAAGNIPVPFTNTSNSQAIIVALMAAINNAPNFAVTAVQLPGTTRISLIGESVTSGATSNAQGIVLSGAPGVAGGAIGISVEETSTTDQIGQSIMAVIDGNQTGGFVAGAAYDRLNFTNALVVDFAGVAQPIFTAAGVPGTLNNLALPVPFLASDNSADIAQRITQVLIGAGFSATQSGSSVFLASVPFGNPQPTFVCTNLATPPDVGADGIPDCPLLTGGTAPGGNITGMAFVGDELYAVTDTGGLFRVANSGGGSFSTNSSRNVADYVDGSRELLEQANATTSFRFDPVSGEFVETVVTEPIRFSGLVAGPENTEDGRYRNMLFGITDEGRLFAFNTHGEPQPVFANGAYYVDTEIFGANGIAFGNLDDNLWHITGDRNLDAGHGIVQAPDESRGTSVSAGSSFYFGYEDPTVQDQFGSQNFRPATPANTYDFPGGSHGSLLSNPFSLKGYSEGDLPTLYFNYFLESEDTDSTENTTLLSANERMRDAFRVYVSGDDGSWKLLTTNNSDRDAPPDDDYIDEFDPFFIIDPETGDFKAEQPFQRADAYDNGPTWRQARVDLSPYAGQENLRLRFDFSTAGGMSTGGNDIQLDLNTAGNELRAIEGAKLQDGQTFTLSDGGFLGEVFEFDMGPTIVAPTGAGIADGGYFEINGTVYEFDLDGSVGMTNNIPHIPIPYTGTETATGVVDRIIDVLAQTPPPPIEYEVNLTDSEPNDTLGTATDSLLDGSTQTYRGTARIGDNTTLVDVTRDVDMVAVHLQQGDKLVAETDTSRLATQLDTYIRLFDENGNELTANDNAEPNNPFNRDSKIEYTITERGTYYVAISGAQNVDYDPTIPESGSISGTVASLGFYEFSIAISDPMGPQVVGNRLNLPNLTEIVPTNLPDGFVDGSGGVSTPPFGSPVTPVRIHAAMTNLEVADAIQVAVADRLAGGNVDSIVRRHEVVVIHGYEVLDSGPLGISGPSDPETAYFGSGLFGDSFGAFDVSSGFNGQTSAFAPGAQRMWDNQHEGVYIDDVIIGFAERGEMITNSTPSQDPIFSANPAEPANEITVGEYQLEIRQSTKYGLSDPNPVFPNLELYDTFDTNQRLADGVTLIARGGEYLADGQTLTVSDGSRTIIFEFEDITISNGVAPEHMALEFDPGDSDLIIARRIRDAINSTEAHQYLDLVAANSDGISQGVDSTSPLVHLFGNAVVTVGLTGPGLDGSVPVGEGNDTLADAVITGIVGGGRESYHATGLIGDNGAVAPLSADVDLFQVELLAGELLTIDIDASENGSPLDSILRVFDATGAPVMQTDFFGQMTPIISDDDTAPDEDVLLYPQLEINRDPYLVFVAPADGTYYIGVSGFDNDVYDATTEGSGRHGSTGRYELRIERPLNSTGLAVVEYRGTGDQNLPREQGQILIRNSRILNSSEFGVVATAGPRGTDSAPTPGPARNLAEVNTSGLVPGVTIVNNVLADNAFGGIDISGDPGGAGLQPATLPLARIINNTVIGNTGPVGTGQVGVGIRVGNNASPTLLNNVLSSVGTGIEVDATSQSSVIGGSLYHNNMTNTTGIGLGDFPIVADANTKLFVDPQNLNYYPAPDSPVIDSSIDSLEDRPELIQIRKPLGIPESPILTPTTDGAGQLRSDDPTVAPPPGIGENVFKDRGAIDRADFAGPEAKLISPLDNGPLDRDPSTTQINLVSASLNEFSIQLSDRTLQGTGIGIDDSTVNAGAVLITEGDRLLQEGVDYTFSYDPTNNIIRLTPLAGLWNSDSNYLIEMVRNDRFVLQVPAGNLISDGDEFTVTGDLGSVVNYEYDSGYVLHVPQTYAIQVPQQGGGIKGIEDGDTITIDNGVTTAVIELDNDGAADTVNHTVVSFTPESSQGEIVDALVTALGQVGVGLSPANAGSGLVHLGVDGSQSVTLQSTTMILVGSATGVIDGDSFTIDDGTRVVEFTFGTGSGGGGTVTQPVNFDASLTYEQLADNIAVAVAASNLGLNPLALEDGHVYLGGGLNHLVNVDNSGLILVGEPGATQAWGFRIPTSAGSFQGLVTDGQVFTLSNAAGVSVTFEFDDDTTVTPGNTAVPFTGNTTTGQLANSLVTIIRNARDGAVPLGLFPFYAGDGIISLGGDATYAIDVTGSTLAELGAPGVPASVPIPYIPGERFEAVDVAAVTADVINAQVPSVVEAVAVGDTVYINRATQVVVPLFDDDQDPNTPPVPVGPLMVSDGSSVRDLAGNPLEPNQSDGGTRFTIFVGQGADYGDAPAPYPTTRADDGARHIVLEGFSLGLTVSIDADGKPSPGADADDDDGVFFNANTPIVPGRTFSLTVLTSGIGSVVNFGILEAWMDYNRDGDWEDSGERIIGNTLLSTGNLNNGAITFSNLRAPASAIPGPTYARFRLSTEGTGMVTGEATAGEVEDYLVQIQTNPWQNPLNPLDVDADGYASPVDVLTLINYINENPNNLQLPLPKPPGTPFLDPNGDGFATAQDVLQVITYLNEVNSGGAGEGEAAPNHLDDVLSLDADWDSIVDDVDRAMGSADGRDEIFAQLAR